MNLSWAPLVAHTASEMMGPRPAQGVLTSLKGDSGVYSVSTEQYELSKPGAGEKLHCGCPELGLGGWVMFVAPQWLPVATGRGFNFWLWPQMTISAASSLLAATAFQVLNSNTCQALSDLVFPMWKLLDLSPQLFAPHPTDLSSDDASSELSLTWLTSISLSYCPSCVWFSGSLELSNIFYFASFFSACPN